MFKVVGPHFRFFANWDHAVEAFGLKSILKVLCHIHFKIDFTNIYKTVTDYALWQML